MRSQQSGTTTNEFSNANHKFDLFTTQEYNSEMQTSFFENTTDVFGGSLLKKSHAKVARPLESKLPTHLVLKAVRGGMRTWEKMRVIDDTFERICKKYDVKLYRYSNNNNHLHAVIKIPNRRMWAAFIRELAGAIAAIMGGAFWACRPFTRIVRGWKKAFAIVLRYVELNALEAAEDISREEARALHRMRHKF